MGKNDEKLMRRPRIADTLSDLMTYPDALSYLGQTRRFGMKLGLEPMRGLARALGDPQVRLRFIHLAGTNGKGSTAARFPRPALPKVSLSCAGPWKRSGIVKAPSSNG